MPDKTVTPEMYRRAGESMIEIRRALRGIDRAREIVLYSSVEWHALGTAREKLQVAFDAVCATCEVES